MSLHEIAKGETAADESNLTGEAVPVVLALAFKYWPKTPMGKAFIGEFAALLNSPPPCGLFYAYMRNSTIQIKIRW